MTAFDEWLKAKPENWHGGYAEAVLLDCWNAALEKQGAPAVQSGEAPSQQLKVKIRLALEQIKGAALNGDKATMFSVINQTYAELSAIE